MGIQACNNKESKFDLSFGKEVNGNKCSKEGLPMSVYILVVVPEGGNRRGVPHALVPAVVQVGSQTSR